MPESTTSRRDSFWCNTRAILAFDCTCVRYVLRARFTPGWPATLDRYTRQRDLYSTECAASAFLIPKQLAVRKAIMLTLRSSAKRPSNTYRCGRGLYAISCSLIANLPRMPIIIFAVRTVYNTWIARYMLCLFVCPFVCYMLVLFRTAV